MAASGPTDDGSDGIGWDSLSGIPGVLKAFAKDPRGFIMQFVLSAVVGAILAVAGIISGQLDMVFAQLNFVATLPGSVLADLGGELGDTILGLVGILTEFSIELTAGLGPLAIPAAILIFAAALWLLALAGRVILEAIKWIT
jgi:hypothetical protein